MQRRPRSVNVRQLRPVVQEAQDRYKNDYMAYSKRWNERNLKVEHSITFDDIHRSQMLGIRKETLTEPSNDPRSSWRLKSFQELFMPPIEELVRRADENKVVSVTVPKKLYNHQDATSERDQLFRVAKIHKFYTKRSSQLLDEISCQIKRKL